ncbi:MAG: GNAT family N-acetyltransferase [Myxococcales bacterium]|nr:GNAT family N-acetyltransferase [Myxococcales bacterium]MCB9733732.1 GNAT family N-acetyltransferase [Deltaproteobacteria bacterium]
MSVIIRPARQGELAAIVAVDARAYGSAGYGPYVVRQLFDLCPEALVVAIESGEIVGYCACAVASDGVGWILSLGTAPEARGRGLGRALTAAAVKALEPLAPAGLRLTVAPDNAHARRIYDALGFTVEHLEPDYYGPGKDRLVMVRRG